MKKIKDVVLNQKLIEKQKITEEGVIKIKKPHRKKNKLFSKISRWMEEGNDKKIILSAKKLKEIEFKMQDVWGFERDSNKHIHWFQNPACSCPTIDNFESFPFRRLYSGDCILHGKLI